MSHRRRRSPLPRDPGMETAALRRDDHGRLYAADKTRAQYPTREGVWRFRLDTDNRVVMTVRARGPLYPGAFVYPSPALYTRT